MEPDPPPKERDPWGQDFRWAEAERLGSQLRGLEIEGRLGTWSLDITRKFHDDDFRI